MPTTAEKPKPFLLPQYCKGCGRCIEACARHCIEMGTEIDPRTGLIPVVLDLENCSACGLCMTACPEPYGLAPEPGTDFELQDPAKLFGRRPFEAAKPLPIPDERLPLPETRPLVTKGTYASSIGALLAGCRHFFGYPITPSTEGAELMAKLLPQLDGVFVQAVSEVATVNMMYGCGGAGLRGDDLHLVARLQPDARGHLLHDRRRAARRLRERDARRPRPRQHRPRAGGHQARVPRARPRQHARHRAGAVDARRRCWTSRSWPSSCPSSTGTRSSCSATATWGR